MRKSGENPEQYPLLYVQELKVRAVRRPLVKTEKVGLAAQEFSPQCMSQKTDDDRAGVDTDGRECPGISGDPMETDGRGRVICRGCFLFCGAAQK